MTSHSLTLLAPAKVNLFLHVLGKNEKNYHFLQSLICFANFGDNIKIEQNETFEFNITNHPELSAEDDNLVIRAAKEIAQATEQDLNVKITLTKNTPTGAGLGGGSADAAAVIRGLMTYSGIEKPPKNLKDILLKLGADVPVCYYNKSSFVEGIGEKITPHILPTNIPALLIYPNEHCDTEQVFKEYNGTHSDKISMPEKFSSLDMLYDYLSKQKNNLTHPAIKNIPSITDVLETLKTKDGCKITRMSGSGSCCFGLFQNLKSAEVAAVIIQKERPNWWVRPTLLNPLENELSV